MGSHNRKWLCHIQLVLPLVTTLNFRTGRKNSRPAFTICFAMDTNPNYSTSRMPTAIRPQCQTGSSRKRLYDESSWSRLYSEIMIYSLSGWANCFFAQVSAQKTLVVLWLIGKVLALVSFHLVQVALAATQMSTQNSGRPFHFSVKPHRTPFPTFHEVLSKWSLIAHMLIGHDRGSSYMMSIISAGHRCCVSYWCFDNRIVNFIINIDQKNLIDKAIEDIVI